MSGLTWRKSSFSGSDGNKECVELAAAPNAVHLRESDEPETVLTIPTARLSDLLSSVKVGQLDELGR
jgi:hypothetical protein